MTVATSSVERKAVLLRESARLFRRFGFHATSMGDLGEVMGVNKGTLYQYYPSKAEILFAIYAEVNASLDENIGAVPADLRADEKLARYVRAIMQTRSTMPDFIAVYFQEHPWLDNSLSAEHARTVRQKEKEFTAKLRAVFEQGVHEGVFRRINLHFATIQLMSMLSSLDRWHVGEDETSAVLVTDTILSYLYEGIQR